MTLDKEIKFFNKNLKKYKNIYLNKYVLIKNERLIGSFDTEENAYNEGVKNFGIDEFLVRQITENEEQVVIPALWVGVKNADL